MSLLNQQIKEYNISKFVIYSTDGSKNCDVRGGFARLQYTESILENYLKLSVTIADTGYSVEKDGELVGLIEGLELSGTEYVELKMEDGLGNFLDFSLSEGTALRIIKIRNSVIDNESMVFTLDLATTEYLENKFVDKRVSGYFSGKISDSVKKILEDYLKTEKELDIEETVNSYNFTGKTTDTPFYKCTWLGKRSIPTTPGANEKSAGFFFFETYDGFKFKSIEKLFDQTGYKKYISNNSTYCPSGYDGKILEVVPSIDIDVEQKMDIGAYGVKVETFNYFDKVYQEAIVSSDENAFNLAGDNLPKFSAEFYTTDSANRATGLFSKIQPVGVAQSITSEKSQQKDYDVQSITAQATIRYNQLYTMILSVTIAGDLSHRAGDLIFCDFPKLTSSKTNTVSGRNSGIYMIADLTQFISARDGIYTKMNLVRDSFGRKSFK